MYNQILSFAMALLLFSVQYPGPEATFSPVETLFGVLALWLFFVLICSGLYRRLHTLPAAPFGPPSVRYLKLQSHLSLLALAFLTFDVYVLNIKYYLNAIPGFEESLTLTGLFALGFYILHLVPIWVQSHPYHCKINFSRITLGEYIKSELVFSMGVLAPWLFISLVTDLLTVLGVAALFDSSWGELLLLGGLMGIFVLFGPWLLVRLWQCKPIPAGPQRAMLEQFCDAHAFTVGDFRHWPILGGESLTAGIVGIVPGLRYILITKGLMDLLSEEELQAVIAHEMGHVRRLHLVFFLILFAAFSIASYSFNDILVLWLLQSETIVAWITAESRWGQTLFSLAHGLPFVLMLAVYFRFIFGFFLRNCERQADIHAMDLQRSPYSIVTSLQKIAIAGGHIEDMPNWHHYSIRERVEFLLRAYKQRQMIFRHHAKLYASACLFLLVMGSAVFGLHRFQETDLFREWQVNAQMHLMNGALGRAGDNPEIHGLYAGLLLEQKKYGDAEALLLKSLEMNSKNPINLNNLAWLYATSPPPFFNPGKALALAGEAVEIEPEPYTLDTLAEAYYAGKQYAEALDTIAKAITLQPENMDYYLDQQKKFRKAMEEAPHRKDTDE